MVILNPFEPWPGELALGACADAGVDVIARVVDYGGLFWDDVRPGHAFAERDHRLFRPDGWVEAAQPRLDAVRPIAARHDLTLHAAGLLSGTSRTRRSGSSPRR